MDETFRIILQHHLVLDLLRTFHWLETAITKNVLAMHHNNYKRHRQCSILPITSAEPTLFTGYTSKD